MTALGTREAWTHDAAHDEARLDAYRAGRALLLERGYAQISMRLFRRADAYACEYCPFAKRKESPVELARDRDALDRFVSWVEARGGETSVFFTPWGEALVRRWYRDAIVRLGHLPHLRRVAIQTNLHAPLDFLREAARDRVALWCTYQSIGRCARQRSQ
ncbi:MAG: hypothetical protein SangKO_087980 [Sandaracinaceae bacterium]